MKSALILEKDDASSVKTSRVLSWLGYVTAPVRTPEEALNVINVIKFDVIVTCTATKPHDRRSFTGELKRAAPEAAVVLITDDFDETVQASTHRSSGLAAVVKRSTSADDLRTIVEIGIDGYGMQPARVLSGTERRRTPFTTSKGAPRGC
jgi:DNA-binding NarL/FixJ family response regulator